MENNKNIYFENDLKFEVEELHKNLFYIKISNNEGDYVVYYDRLFGDSGKIEEIKIGDTYFYKRDNEISKLGKGLAKKEIYLKADILLKKISKAFDSSTAHNKKFANIGTLQIAFYSRYGLIGKL